MAVNVRTRRAGARLACTLAALAGAGFATPSCAHTGQRAFVLLLPTREYIVGGALVVALSFVLLAVLPARWPRGAARPRPTGVRWRDLGAWPGRIVLAVLAVLVAAGFAGPRDPLANPLPTLLWSWWWIGLTFAHALLGNLWSVLSPFPALHRLASVGRRPRALLSYPRALGCWPAVGLFAAFAWFELVYPAPQDPARLAVAVLSYAGITLAGMVLFGPRTWLRHGEAFQVFFTLVSWLAPIGHAGARLAWHWPGARLLRRRPLSASGAAFVLMALATVSFDGFSRSFTWLGLLGENPLEYPGRSALVVPATLGLAAAFAVFVLACAAASAAGNALAGRPPGQGYGSFVLSLVPIAFGYHFAHYLPAFLVDAQYALRAVSDPFGRGWDLFSTADFAVTTSLLTHHASVALLWQVQTAAIVVAHLCAVVVAHARYLREAPGDTRRLAMQLPAMALMIGYTVFGLWLLSTPTAG